MAAPIINKNLHFEDSFKVHDIHKICVTTHMDWYVGFGGILRAFEY